MKREQERLEKERMRRLMAEDEEGYRKLIDKASFILDGLRLYCVAEIEKATYFFQPSKLKLLVEKR